MYPGDEADFAELEGIRLCAYWDAKSNQSWRLPFHRNEGLEIGFVSNGSVDFSADKAENKFTTLTSEHITVTKPWQEHAIGNPVLTSSKMLFLIIDFGIRRPNQDWEWPNWVILSDSDKREFSQYVQNTNLTIFKSTGELRAIFREIFSIIDENKIRESISMLSILFNRILLELLSIFRGDSNDYSKDSPNINVVKCFLQQLETYCHENWTLAAMAEDCGLKTTRFTYYCKLLANSTPMNLLNLARLNRAKKIIEQSPPGENLSMTDVEWIAAFQPANISPLNLRKHTDAAPGSILPRST